MKMITSLTFEIDMPDKEIAAYKAMSEKEREQRIESMKEGLADIIDNECDGDTNFTKFTIHFEEGE